ncbi:MAG: hypothetical protein EP338_12520 [Bacteroidetes bacterium]|nr:MAG: hypothetical protein EP338_12520 [Bacteroidota bacterium]
MILRIQTKKLITSPAELAQKRLKNHQQAGNSSKLSIFEVARLMDQASAPDEAENSSSDYFDICYN